MESILFWWWFYYNNEMGGEFVDIGWELGSFLCVILQKSIMRKLGHRMNEEVGE